MAEDQSTLTRAQAISVRRAISKAWARVIERGPVRCVKLSRCCKSSGELVAGSLMDAIHEEINALEIPDA